MLDEVRQKQSIGKKQESLVVTKISVAEFNDMQREWNALLDGSACRSVFLTWEWIEAWWRQFSCKRELVILTVRIRGELVGIAPFYMETLLPFAEWRMAKFCGAEELYPDYLDIIAKRGYEEVVAEAIFEHFLRTESKCVIMRLDNLLDSSNVMNHIKRAKTHLLYREKLSSICPYLRIEGTFDDYLKRQFNGKKRYNLKRQVHILTSDMKLSFKEMSGGDIEKLLDRLFQLHLRRADSKSIASTFQSDKIINFHKTFCAANALKGIIKLYLLCHEEEPVCMMYCFSYGSKLLFYQSGLEPTWDRYSVGTALLMLAIERCFSGGYAEFDFLKGQEKYKLSWSTGERSQRRLVLYRRTIVGIVFYSVERMRSVLREVANKIKLRSALSNKSA